MTDEEIIERITRRLFENGNGEQADRLVLTTADGKDLGGWCRQAVRAVVSTSLTALIDGPGTYESARGVLWLVYRFGNQWIAASGECLVAVNDCGNKTNNLHTPPLAAQGMKLVRKISDGIEMSEQR